MKIWYDISFFISTILTKYICMIPLLNKINKIMYEIQSSYHWLKYMFIFNYMRVWIQLFFLFLISTIATHSTKTWNKNSVFFLFIFMTLGNSMFPKNLSIFHVYTWLLLQAFNKVFIHSFWISILIFRKRRKSILFSFSHFLTLTHKIFLEIRLKAFFLHTHKGFLS